MARGVQGQNNTRRRDGDGCGPDGEYMMAWRSETERNRGRGEKERTGKIKWKNVGINFNELWGIYY